MNTISINKSLYEGAEIYAKLHHISVEAVVEKGLNLLFGKNQEKGKEDARTSDLEKALELMDTMMVSGGQVIPLNAEDMNALVEKKQLQ